MIPKIIPGRRDRKSSLGQLVKYMVDKPSDSLTDKVQPTSETVSARPELFDDLTGYMVRDENLVSEATEVEPGVTRQSVGVVTTQFNTFGLETAAQEMNSVALQNHRCKEPVLHYVLSWPAHEKPDDDQVFGSVKFTLEALGMADHQYVAAIHRDTDNLHVHVAANRIHPQTYKAATLSLSKDTLHQACRILELKNNWTPTDGAYVINDKQDIVRKPKQGKGRSNSRSLDRINKVETKSGTESLFRYITGEKDQPGSQQTYLHVAAGLREAKCWNDVHQAFAEVGLRFEKAKGKKGFVITHTQNNTVTAVKASLVFNREQYNASRLTERLGEFTASNVTPAPVSVYDNAYHPAAYKRDAGKRLERKVARAEARLLLKGRYKAYRNNLPRFEVDPDGMRDRFKMITHHTKLTKAHIKSTVSDPHMRRLMYNLAEFKRQQAIADLRLSVKEQRNGFAAANPRLSYREWIEQEALKGDSAALSQMRGFAYSERRKAKYKQQLVKEIGFERTYNAVSSAERDDVPVMASARHETKPRLLKDGTQVFMRNGRPVAADRGHIVLVESVQPDDDKAVDLAVALTLAGKAGDVRFDGDREFKEKGVQRITNAAVEHRHPVAEQITFSDAAQKEFARHEQQRLLQNGNDSKNETEMKNRSNGQFKPQ